MSTFRGTRGGYAERAWNRNMTERTPNGETVVAHRSEGVYRDANGLTGYWPRFGGGWICYTCGALCEPEVHGVFDED